MKHFFKNKNIQKSILFIKLTKKLITNIYKYYFNKLKPIIFVFNTNINNK